MDVSPVSHRIKDDRGIVLDCSKIPDVFTKAKRSEVMSRIRGRGNKDTEIALAKLLRRQGITGWRRNQQVFGKPDFIFQKARLAIFVDGCFWHGCPKHATWPAHRAAWWRRKIEGNKTRDRVMNQTLRRAEWRVVRIWEHALPRLNSKGQRLKQNRLVKKLKSLLK